MGKGQPPFTSCRRGIVVLTVLLLGACGGGGGGDGNNPPPVQNASLGGIWYGTVTNTTVGESYQVAGVSLANGELRFIDDQSVQYSGTMQVSGNSVSATIRAIAPLGSQFANGATVINGSLNGTIVARSALNANYTMSTGERGTVSLVYDPDYERDSSLSRISGMWTDEFGTVTEISGSGQVFAQDGAGCVYNGNVSVVNSSFNAYRLNLTVSNCGQFNGSYSGLGVITDLTSTNDNRQLIYQVSNSVWSVTSSLAKL